MTVLTSAVEPGSDAARANDAAQRGLAEELRERTADVARGGPASARDRHVARGKLLPRDRVDRLLDEGSPFLEIAPLAGYGVDDGAWPARASSPGSGWSAGGRSWSCATTRP